MASFPSAATTASWIPHRLEDRNQRQPVSSGFLKNFCHSCIAFLLIWATSACAWRTAEADHFIGPILFRAIQPPEGKAYIWEEKSVFPLMFEAGEHSGMTIGLIKRLTAYPVDGNTTWLIKWCSGIFSFSCSRPSMSDGWHWSLFYSRVVHGKAPEFHDRTVIGTSIGAGTDGRYLTIGYSAETQLRPRDNAYYIFCYTRRDPLRMRFEVAKDATEFANYFNQEACK